MLGKSHKYHAIVWFVSGLVLVSFYDQIKAAMGTTGTCSNWITFPAILVVLAFLVYAVVWLVGGVLAYQMFGLSANHLTANLLHASIGAFGGILVYLAMMARDGFGPLCL